LVWRESEIGLRESESLVLGHMEIEAASDLFTLYEDDGR
jgi:hypothetical protein